MLGYLCCKGHLTSFQLCDPHHSHQAQSLCSKMKGLEQMVFRVLLPSTVILCMVAMDKVSLSFTLLLGNILVPGFPPHPSLFSVPTSTLPHTASFQITPQNTVKMSQFPELQHASFPARVLRLIMMRLASALPAFLKAFLKDWLAPLILYHFPMTPLVNNLNHL